MSKNITIAIILIIFIFGGIGYAIYSAPERPEHLLFEQAIKKFSTYAAPLEKQFREKQSLPEFNQTASLSLPTSSKTPTTIPLKITTQNNTITLLFGEGDSTLANQTIILEPFIKKDKVRWKCINGSVLIRFRSKECRLGQGVSTH